MHCWPGPLSGRKILTAVTVEYKVVDAFRLVFENNIFTRLRVERSTRIETEGKSKGGQLTRFFLSGVDAFFIRGFEVPLKKQNGNSDK